MSRYEVGHFKLEVMKARMSVVGSVFFQSRSTRGEVDSVRCKLGFPAPAKLTLRCAVCNVPVGIAGRVRFEYTTRYS